MKFAAPRAHFPWLSRQVACCNVLFTIALPRLRSSLCWGENQHVHSLLLCLYTIFFLLLPPSLSLLLAQALWIPATWATLLSYSVSPAASTSLVTVCEVSLLCCLVSVASRKVLLESLYFTISVHYCVVLQSMGFSPTAWQCSYFLNSSCFMNVSTCMFLNRLEILAGHFRQPILRTPTVLHALWRPPSLMVAVPLKWCLVRIAYGVTIYISTPGSITKPAIIKLKTAKHIQQITISNVSPTVIYQILGCKI